MKKMIFIIGIISLLLLAGCVNNSNTSLSEELKEKIFEKANACKEHGPSIEKYDFNYLRTKKDIYLVDTGCPGTNVGFEHGESPKYKVAVNEDNVEIISPVIKFDFYNVFYPLETIDETREYVEVFLGVTLGKEPQIIDNSDCNFYFEPKTIDTIKKIDNYFVYSGYHWDDYYEGTGSHDFYFIELRTHIITKNGELDTNYVRVADCCYDSGWSE